MQKQNRRIETTDDTKFREEKGAKEGESMTRLIVAPIDGKLCRFEVRGERGRRWRNKVRAWNAFVLSVYRRMRDEP